jgi:hypothetical protein
MKKIIVTLILGILVLIAIVQTFQINEIKTKLTSGKVITANAPVISSSQEAIIPNNLQNLPAMVGGC